MAAAGEDVIELTLGEPDVEVPEELKESAIAAIRRGRTKYAAEQGEPQLLEALAEHYTARVGRPIAPENVLCFPGTQTALFAAMMTLADAGDEVLVGDPMYATYEAVIRSTGATMVPVKLKPENGFRMRACDIAPCISARSRVILLTTPHNPSGSILTRSDIAEIANLAARHDLWIVSDEVYADLIFEGQTFVSPLEFDAVRDRVVVVSSISKSHAAPGFRSGWSIGSKEFVQASVLLCDTMLFGNQPFIADMTVDAIRMGSSVVAGMRQRYSARAQRLERALGNGKTMLDVYRPQAGMFALVDVRRTGLSGKEFARELLDECGVATMPGSSFGASLDGFIRICLTAKDDAFDEALRRIVRFCDTISPQLYGAAGA
ncbi:putative Aspartate aminotransferase [Mesorhizobium metallidurans STM 2683]|uniref:aspartate transaminase n=2 Tax=Mesorhizobium metallidurans TaxID=489722 RepID=M5EZ15_9HYPH|nr:putative Aspartate aminotransferase [Mesorhizobium metallidurans STM 2683]